MPLGPKQNAFVAEYLKDLNATKAAERAGYSPKTARNQGSRLLANEDIAKAIAEAQDRRAQRVEVKSDDVLRVLLRNLETDVKEAYDAEGRPLALHEMPESIRKAIQSFEEEDLFEDDGDGNRLKVGVVRKVKFWSKDKAMELGMRHLGLLKDKVEVSGTLSLEQLVMDALKPKGGT